MSNITTHVPAGIARLLREALYAQLGRAFEDAPGGPQERTREGWADLLARVEGIRAALDALGWATPEQEPVTLALDRAMIEALEADLDHWQWTAQAEHLETVEGRQQAARTAELIERFLTGLPRRPVTLMVPSSLVGCVAEGAEVVMHDIAQAIDHGADLRECARRLTAVAGLLDAITQGEAGAVVELDVSEHGETLRRAVAMMLPTLEQGMADTRDGDPAKPEREHELRLMRQLAAQVIHATGGGENGDAE